MSIRKLAGQTAVYGISSIAVRLLNYLLTPYLTRVMTQGEYGVITDMYALIPFALVLLTMGLESGYFKFAGQADSDSAKKRIFANVSGSVILASLLFFGIVLLFNGRIADWTGYSAYPSYVWVTGAIIAVDAISAIPFARLRQEGRSKRFVMLRLFSVLVNIFFCLFFYSALPKLAAAGGVFAGMYDPSYGAGYYLISNLIATFATFVLLIPCYGGIRPRISRRVLRPIMLYSLPLFLSGIAGTANEFIDRQMIKYLMPADISMSALGVYGAVTKIGVVLLLFTQMYRLAAEPYFLSGFKREDFVRTNAEAMKYFVLVSIMIFLGVMLFSDLFALIVGPDFREGMYILPVILVSNILTGVILNLSFWYKHTGKTRYALIVTGTGLTFTLIFNILLVPVLGILGAALARLACELAMTVVSYFLNAKHYPTPYNLGRIGFYVLLGALIYGISYLTARLDSVLKYTLNLLLLLSFAAVAVKKENLTLRTFFRNNISNEDKGH